MKTFRFPMCRAGSTIAPRAALSASLRALALVAFVLAAATAAAQRPQQGQMFERLDKDGNGVIESEELESTRRAAFDRADANGDDYVTGDELEALRQELESAVAAGRRGMRGGRFAGPRRGQAAPGDRMQRLDADEDGRISEQEFVSAPNPLLERFDANGDGQITRPEIDEARAEMREQFRDQRRRAL